MQDEVMRSFFQAVNERDLDRVAEMVAEDVTFEFPGSRFGGRFEGRRRLLVFLKQNQRLFENGLRFDVHAVFAGPDRGAVQWTNAGTTRAGQAYENRGVTVFQWDALGRFTSLEDYLDTERIAETWPVRGSGDES